MVKLPPYFRSLPAKIILCCLIAAFIFFAFVGLALPKLLQWQLPIQLQKATNHQLTLTRLSINPFLFRVMVGESQLKTPQGNHLASFNQLMVNLSPTRLLLGEIELSNFHASNPHITFVLNKNNQHNWQPFLGALKAGNDKAEPPKKESSFDFILLELNIDNGRFSIADQRTPKGFETEITPINLDLKNLTTKPNKTGEVVLKAETENGAKLEVKSLIDLAQSQLMGSLSLDELALNTFKPIAKQFLPVVADQGKLKFSADYQINFPAKKPFNFAISNAKLQLANLLIQNHSNPAAKVQLSSLLINNANYTHKTQKSAVDSIHFNNFKLIPATTKEPLAWVSQLKLEDISTNVTDRNTTLKAIKLNTFEVTAERLKTGQFTLVEAINSLWPTTNEQVNEKTDIQTQDTDNKAKAPKQSATQTETPTKKPLIWNWSVKQVDIRDGQVEFIDNQHQPRLAYTLEEVEVLTQQISSDFTRPIQLTTGLKIQGGGQLKAEGEILLAETKLNAKLDLQAFSLAHLQPFLEPYVLLEITQGTASANGLVSVLNTSGTFEGNATLNKLKLNKTQTNNTFLTLNSLTLSDIVASNDNTTVKQINLNGFETRLAIAKDKSTNIDSLIVEQPQTSNSQKQETNKKNTPSKPMYPLAINRFSIENSELEFEDLSLIIPFGVKIKQLKGAVNGFSTQANTTSQIELTGQVNETGYAKASGKLSPLNPTQQLEMDVQFKNLAMADLTPYTATFVNRKIKSGTLDLELNYAIENSELNSTNRIIAEKLQLGEQVDSPEAVDLPLELAIALLEDSNGVIDLGLPIQGDLAQPEFEFGDIVMKTLKNILTKLVTSPFRALAGLLGPEETFDQITFEVGEKQLSPPQKEEALKLVKLLNKRPRLSLLIQGTWSVEDQTTLQERAYRTQVLKQQGITLKENEKPGLLAMSSPDTLAALETLYKNQFGEDAFFALKKGFEQANPEVDLKLETENAMTSFANVLTTNETLEDEQIQKLKEKNFHEILGAQLLNTITITENTMIDLATTRSKQLSQALTAEGIAETRIEIAEPYLENAAEGNIPIKIELTIQESK